MSNNRPTSSDTKSTMPPGMVMGPDGKPCKACTAFRNWKPASAKINSNASPKGGQRSTAAMMAAFASGSHSTTPKDVPPAHCPLDVEQLGRATWAFLHTTAAYYPEHPTPNQRANMLSLIRALPVLYPCSHCASHLSDNMKDHPPNVSGRVALSQWLCERHNDVNERLGKEKFDCTNTNQRWKDGLDDGSCD